ncbi:hypothetical protein O1611_g2060 [Lasiodiplodia mahajangana]|uniref:Uncharacterized protein n=1 Tax=Lasiodiplodia mahajangana TaxID=1108764 RepID=A0ACC2JVQ4_9PEZI|nr:hypothetical protein O1611_g2060 [Lasiodiplodia mahajangana]
MSNVNDDIWCDYALGIQTWAGKSTPDPNAVYFIASAVNKGPAAGSFVPDANMNFTLSKICDALIRSDKVVYNPGTEGSYFNNLYRHIWAVKLKQNLEQGLQQQLKEATEASITAQTNYNTQRDNAIAEWKKDEFSGRDANVDLQTWATSNAPLLFNAQVARDSRAQVVTQLNSQIFGSGAAKLTQEQNACLKADDKLVPVIGLNMKVADGQISANEYRKYYKALQDGSIGTLPPIQEGPVTYAPAYSIDPTYKVTMDEWARVPLDAKPEFNWTIKTETTKKSDWSKVGHQEGVGGFKLGWIQIGGGASKDWKESNVVNESGSYEIQLSAQRAGLFNVYPGAWNVQQFNKIYPDTIGDIPLAKDAVQPTQLLCASRVKLRVRFTGAKETAFDNLVKEVKGGSGGFSILGFSVGASAGRTEEEQSHESNLVKKDGWYEINPTLVDGGCSMLAVIGNKLNA